MKVGDLAITHNGNYCIILEIGNLFQGKVSWYNILFCSSGATRCGFPADWLKRVQ